MLPYIAQEIFSMYILLVDSDTHILEKMFVIKKKILTSLTELKGGQLTYQNCVGNTINSKADSECLPPPQQNTDWSTHS